MISVKIGNIHIKQKINYEWMVVQNITIYNKNGFKWTNKW